MSLNSNGTVARYVCLHLFSDLVHENGILSSGSDGLPYTTLSYGNGESYTYFRRDLSLVDTSNILLLYMYHTEESMVDQNSVNAHQSVNAQCILVFWSRVLLLIAASSLIFLLQPF